MRERVPLPGSVVLDTLRSDTFAWSTRRFLLLRRIDHKLTQLKLVPESEVAAPPTALAPHAEPIFLAKSDRPLSMAVSSPTVDHFSSPSKSPRPISMQVETFASPSKSRPSSVNMDQPASTPHPTSPTSLASPTGPSSPAPPSLQALEAAEVITLPEGSPDPEKAILDAVGEVCFEFGMCSRVPVLPQPLLKLMGSGP